MALPVCDVTVASFHNFQQSIAQAIKGFLNDTKLNASVHCHVVLPFLRRRSAELAETMGNKEGDKADKAEMEIDKLNLNETVLDEKEFASVGGEKNAKSNKKKERYYWQSDGLVDLEKIFDLKI